MIERSAKPRSQLFELDRLLAHKGSLFVLMECEMMQLQESRCRLLLWCSMAAALQLLLNSWLCDLLKESHLYFDYPSTNSNSTSPKSQHIVSIWCVDKTRQIGSNLSLLPDTELESTQFLPFFHPFSFQPIYA